MRSAYVFAALAGTIAAPALAQIPPTNTTIQGTQGPNSNSAGYPSAAVQVGRLTTAPVGSGGAPASGERSPDAAPDPANVAAGQPTMNTANGTKMTPGTPK